MALLQYLNICVCYNLHYDRQTVIEETKNIDSLLFEALLVGKDKDNDELEQKEKEKERKKRIDE